MCLSHWNFTMETRHKRLMVHIGVLSWRRRSSKNKISPPTSNYLYVWIVVNFRRLYIFHRIVKIIIKLEECKNNWVNLKIVFKGWEIQRKLVSLNKDKNFKKYNLVVKTQRKRKIYYLQKWIIKYDKSNQIKGKCKRENKIKRFLTNNVNLPRYLLKTN